MCEYNEISILKMATFTCDNLTLNFMNNLDIKQNFTKTVKFNCDNLTLNITNNLEYRILNLEIKQNFT